MKEPPNNGDARTSDPATVSVVIPCYNCVPTLPETLDSVLSQTYRDFEIIAVNDGSKDNTAAILTDYAARCSGRLRVFDQENAGPAASRNRAIKQSRATYIAFIDADDIWYPSKLERQVAMMEANPRLGLTCTTGFDIDAEGKVVCPFPTTLRFLRGRCVADLIVRNNVTTSTVMTRRAVFHEVGLFDPSLPVCEDWDLWIRIACFYDIDHIAEPLACWRMHDANTQRDTDGMRHYSLQVVDRNLARFRHAIHNVDLRAREAYYATYLLFANQYQAECQFGKARADYMRALRLNPWRREVYVRILQNVVLTLAAALQGGGRNGDRRSERSKAVS